LFVHPKKRGFTNIFIDMKKVIKLTESDLANLVRRVLRERDGDDAPKIPPFKMGIYEKAFDWVLEQVKNGNFGYGTDDDLGQIEQLQSDDFQEFLKGFAYEMTMWILGRYPRAMEGAYFFDPESDEVDLSEEPFDLTYDIIKSIYKDKIREVFEGGMEIGQTKPSKIYTIAKEIMSSPLVREVEVGMDPSEYEDEFEYADNFFYNLLSDHEDEDYYDDLMEHIKDEFSELIFSFYFNS
jgi:hypothetical protein